MALNVSGNLNLDPAEIERLRMAANAVADTNQKSNLVDNEIDPEEEIARLGGMSTLINASMFVDGVNVPSQISERVLREANFANRLDTTGMTIGSGSGGGAIKIITSKDEDGDGVDDDEQNGMKDMVQAVIDAQEQEAWAQEEHTLNGVTKTGEEWSRLADEIRHDQKARDWLVRELMSRGMTQQQAQVKADEYANAAEAMSKPPSQRTAADNAAITTAQNDPNFAPTMQRMDEQRAKGFDVGANTVVQNADVGQGQSNRTMSRVATYDVALPPLGQRAVADNTAITNAQNDLNFVTAMQRMDEQRLDVPPQQSGENTERTVSSTRGDFSSAPNLNQSFGHALTATEPLDTTPAQPTRVASNTINTTLANTTTAVTPVGVL